MKWLVEKLYRLIPGVDNNLSANQKTAVVLITYSFTLIILIRIIHDVIKNF